jgi:PKD repeat protein
MYPVTLSITDSVGSTDEDITWAEIVPELKAYTNGPYNSTIGSQVQFNGSARGGAPPYTWWEWDFGDGNTSTMQNPTQIYTTPGNHTVILTVHDNDYNTANDRTWVFIKDNSPPVLPIISGPTSGIPGEEYRYTFTSVDPDGDDLYYWILWGDDQIVEWNGPYQSGREVQFTHVYLSQGTYTISVKAKDTHEAESHWSYLHITMPKNKLCINPMLRIFVYPFLPKLLQYHILE